MIEWGDDGRASPSWRQPHRLRRWALRLGLLLLIVCASFTVTMVVLAFIVPG